MRVSKCVIQTFGANFSCRFRFESIESVVIFFLEHKYEINSLPGLSGVSKHSVAIHVKGALDDEYIKVPFLMLRYHVIIHFEEFEQFHPPLPHPHAGARNEKGEWKYVSDTSTEHLKQSPLLESLYLKACKGDGEGKGGFHICIRTVISASNITTSGDTNDVNLGHVVYCEHNLL